MTWESFVRLTNAGTGLTEAVRESVVVVVRQYIQNKRAAGGKNTENLFYLLYLLRLQCVWVDDNILNVRKRVF